jgi:hypothetical protein
VGFLLNGLLGIVLGALMHKALSGLPSFYEELQVLGIIEQPSVSTEGLRIIGATLIAVLYAVHPVLGGVLALASFTLPVTMMHTALGVLYLVMVLLLVPCLAKRGGILLVALIPLMFVYPQLTFLLPLLPVLAGMLYGRFFGPYIAAYAALALIVLGLVAGRAAVGTVYVEGDVDAFMETEEMVLIQDKAPLIPPYLYEKSDFVAFATQDLQSRIVFVFLCLNWMGPLIFGSAGLLYFGLLPRLVAPILLAQAILWLAVAGFVSWLTWAATRRRTAWAILGTAAAAVAGTLVTAAGHLVIPRVFGAPSTLPSVFQGIASAVLSAISATVCAMVVAWLRSPRATLTQSAEASPALTIRPAGSIAAPNAPAGAET